VLQGEAAARGEHAGDEDAIQIQRGAVSAEAVDAGGKLGAAAREVRVGGLQVHGARGVAEPEDVGVGAAADLHRVDIERIHRHPTAGLEVAEGEVGRAHATDSIGVRRIDLGVVDRGAVAVERVVGERAGTLGPRLVEKKVV